MFPGVRSVIFSGAPAQLTLENLAITSSDNAGQNVDANYLIDSDGGTRKFTESAGSGSTADVTAWHGTHPATGIGAQYEIRMVHTSGTSRYTGTPTLGDWTTISSDIEFNFDYAPGSPDTDVSTYTVTIGLVGTSTAIATAVLTVSLEELSP